MDREHAADSVAAATAVDCIDFATVGDLAIGLHLVSASESCTIVAHYHPVYGNCLVTVDSLDRMAVALDTMQAGEHSVSSVVDRVDNLCRKKNYLKISSDLHSKLQSRCTF